jgi:hypothetical protein
MKTTIKNIWKKYHTKAIPKAIEKEILSKAEVSYTKAKKKYKLATYVSWWTRKYATKKK